MIQFIAHLFSTNGFPARWNCGPSWRQEPWLGWMHILSDLTIWLCYFAIPILLLALTRKKRDLPFPSLIVLFALFILACGGTHLADAIIFYVPIYRLAGFLKLATAIFSLSTVVALFFVLPKALQLKGPKQAEIEINQQTAELLKRTEQLRHEVAAHKSTLMELQQNKELLQFAMSASDLGFFHWNLESDQLKIDEALIRLYGLVHMRDSELTLEQFLENVSPEFRKGFTEKVNESIEQCKNYDYRFQFLRPDGRSLWVSSRGMILRNANGFATSLIGFHQDISDHIEREAKLDELAKQAIIASDHKTRFIAQVSHEIRTPLTAMLGGLDSLLMDLPWGDTRESIRVVRSQGELLQILVNDVLDLSKIEAGHLLIQKSYIDVAHLIADVCSLMDPLAIEKGLSIRWISESKLPSRILCDGHRLKQVFVNLIGNAIQFTDRGEIVISVRATQDELQRGTLEVEVRDTGRGIPIEQQSSLFDEHQHSSLNVFGSGLGLAICRKLMELMDGAIQVRSVPGSGSTFEISLPIGDLSQQQLVDIDPIQKNNSKDKSRFTTFRSMPLRVLVAEDTRAIQLVLRAMLEKYVDELKIVSNGQEAIEQVQRNGMDSGFDVILMDIQMPFVDGAKATSELRKMGFSKPIVALTAGAMESERKACMEAGCTHFIAKPIDLDTLRRTLESIASNDVANPNLN